MASTSDAAAQLDNGSYGKREVPTHNPENQGVYNGTSLYGKPCETLCSQMSTAPGTPPGTFVMPERDEHEACTSKSMQTDTLIYLDVDGVLNVGVDDGGTNPISFNGANIEVTERKKHVPEAGQNKVAHKMLATYMRKAGGDDKTYAEICSKSSDVVDIFVERLASIIKAAGLSGTLVLSSSWRRSVHKIFILETALSRFLGSSFAIKDKTALEEDLSPSGRLLNIADHVAEHCATRANQCQRLRILVLEDFHIHAIGSWSCCGQAITSVQDVEVFLTKCVPTHIAASAKLIHTYDAWTASNGTFVQIGSGLTLNHFNDAMQFLSKDKEVLVGIDAGTEKSRSSNARSCARRWRRQRAQARRLGSSLAARCDQLLRGLFISRLSRYGSLM